LGVGVLGLRLLHLGLVVGCARHLHACLLRVVVGVPTLIEADNPPPERVGSPLAMSTPMTWTWTTTPVA
jgi:hypothetical protein